MSYIEETGARRKKRRRNGLTREEYYEMRLRKMIRKEIEQELEEFERF